ncbi:hypothetical protein [Fontibacter flavus]|uniref:Uncharacterized protein n=1 Tax=Fontibacter flavus TaxID=654838 RepID=A0ABV6FU33_9BACT
MNFLILRIILFLLVTQISFAQTNIEINAPVTWERVHIKGLGSFDLPSTMEIQKGKYREYMDQIYKIKGFDTERIVAQQVGLNEMESTGFERYARVILETKIGQYGDFVKLDFELPEMSKSELDELNIIFKEQIKNHFVGTGIRLTEWYPLKFQKVNNMSCLQISYIRKLNDSPEVMVNTYYFYNNDRVHELTLSYRINESDFWKSDFDKILKSFKITNVR